MAEALDAVGVSPGSQTTGTRVAPRPCHRRGGAKEGDDPPPTTESARPIATGGAPPQSGDGRLGQALPEPRMELLHHSQAGAPWRAPSGWVDPAGRHPSPWTPSTASDPPGSLTDCNRQASRTTYLSKPTTTFATADTQAQADARRHMAILNTGPRAKLGRSRGTLDNAVRPRDLCPSCAPQTQRPAPARRRRSLNCPRYGICPSTGPNHPRQSGCTSVGPKGSRSCTCAGPGSGRTRARQKLDARRHRGEAFDQLAVGRSTPRAADDADLVRTSTSTTTWLTGATPRASRDRPAGRVQMAQCPARADVRAARPHGMAAPWR